MKDQHQEDSPSGVADQISLPQLILETNNIAEQVGRSELTEPLIDLAAGLEAELRDVVIQGVLEGRFLNNLLRMVVFPNPVAAYPYELIINDAGDRTSPYFISNGEPRPLEFLLSDREALTSGQPVQVYIDDPWLRAHKLRLCTRPLPGDTTEDEAELFKLYERTDAVFFLVDSLMPLSKQETFYLKKYAAKSIPCFVFLARFQSLTELEDQESVTDYVQDWVNRHLPAASLFIPSAEADNDLFFATAAERLAQADIPGKRMDLLVDRVIYALLQVRVTILDTKEAGKRAVAAADIASQAEQRQLARRSDEWIKIENEMIKRGQELGDTLRIQLSKHRAQIRKLLLFELERSPDPKACWQRDLPFVLNRELQAAGEKLNGLLTREISELLQWLQLTVSSTFEFDLAFGSDLIFSGEIPAALPPKKLALLDASKMRLRGRYGTAATVVIAGTLLVFTGVGGVAMATSILFGAGVEQYIVSRGKKDKTTILNELDKVIQQAELLYVDAFAEKLKKEFDKLLLTLKMSQAKWLSQKQQQLANKISGEVAGVKQQDLDQLLQRVNTLLAGII